MEIHEFRRHPHFSLRDGSRLFRGCWTFRLKQGENTRHRLQSRAEEIYLILQGKGRMTVGGRTSLVRPGEVIFVPPRVGHHLENDASPLLQGVSIEAVHGEDEPESTVTEEPQHGGARRLDEILAALPAALDGAVAIRAIVELFDICGSLSQRIDEALGLDNEVGVDSLARLEEKLMQSVGTIVDRYRRARSLRSEP